MGYFKPQRPIQTKLTNWCSGPSSELGSTNWESSVDTRKKLNRQAWLAGSRIGLICSKSAKKWPGHFSMKFSNHNYKPGLLAQAQGTKIRHKEVKTSSKSRPRLPLGPLVSDWHFYLGKLELSYHNKIVELWALPTSFGTQMKLFELKTSSPHRLKAFL